MNKRALSRVLAAFLAVVMTLGVFAALPGIGDSTVRAEIATGVPRRNIPEIDYANAGGKITLGKDAWLEADGTYTIQLSSYSTGVMDVIRKTGVVATDFIIVCDLSSSMKDVQTVPTIDENGNKITGEAHTYNLKSLKAALGELIPSIRSSSDQYAKHRVSLITYGCGYMLGYAGHGLGRKCVNTGFYRNDLDKGFVGGIAHNQMDALLEQHYDKAMFDVTDETEFNRLMADAQGFSLVSGTETAMDWGMKMAYQIAKKHNNDTYLKPTGEYDENGNMRTVPAPRNQVVIVMTDGVPGFIQFKSTVAAASLNYASAIKRLPGNKTTIFTTDLRCQEYWDMAANQWSDDGLLPWMADLGTHSATFKAVNENGEYDERMLLKHTDGIPYYKRGWTTDGWDTRWWDKDSTEYSPAKVQEALEKQQERYDQLGLQEGFLIRDLLYLMSSDYEMQNPGMPKGRIQAYALSTADMWRLYRYFNSGAYRPFNIVGTGVDGHVNENFQNEMFGLNETPGYRWPAYNRWGVFQSTTNGGIDGMGQNWNIKNGWYTKYAVGFENADAPKRYTTFGNPDYNGGADFDLPADMLPPYVTENISDPIRDHGHYQRGIVYVVRLQSGNNKDYLTIGGNYVNYMITKLVHPNGGYFAQEGYQDELSSGGTRNVNIKQLMYDEDADGNLTLKCRYYIPVNVRGDGGLIDPVLGINTEAAKALVKAFLDFEDYSYEVTTVESNMGEYAAMVDTLSEDFYIDENCAVKIYTDALQDVEGNTYTFRNAPVEITSNPGVGADIDVAGKKIKVYGFDFSADENICKKIGGTVSGKRVIAVITGVLAHDTAIGTVATNIENRSGLMSHTDDVRPSDFDTLNGKKTLLFPKPEVRIRDKYVVYDYGFKLTDDNLTGFFSDEGDNQDVGHVLSIDYLFNRQRNSTGALNYHNEYPYKGARGMDADGNPIAEYTSELLEDEIFKVGFKMEGFDPNAEHPDGNHACTGYFEPHAIARRDFRVAALLRLTDGTYEWSTLTFIPATNVLYEAEQGVSGSNLKGDFVSYQNISVDSSFDSSNSDLKGIWSVEGSFDTTATQQHYNKLYGYDPVYDGKLDCDANGASMKVTVNNALYEAVRAEKAQWPVAKFSFEGSGFSFTTRCALNTGIFIVDVVPHGQHQKYNGTTSHPATGGYTPVEGDNYHTLVNTRYYGGSETPDGSALLHQIPVFRRGHMPYQAYDVYLTPVYFPAWANDPTQNVSTRSGEEVSMRLDKIIPGIGDIEYTITNAVESGEGDATRAVLPEFTSYIDTVRIYHPRGASVHAMNMDDHEYYAAHEMNAKYVETRSLLINSIQNLAHGGNGGNIAGAIFLDYGPVAEGGNQHFDATNPTTYSISNYVKFGPNNEMYLKGMTDENHKGGSFTFAIANPDRVTNLHLSMKAHESNQAATVKVKFLAKNGDQYTVIQGIENDDITVHSTTEMYYDLLKGLNAEQKASIAGITIECTGSVTLSIVNLKIVYEDGYVESSQTGSVNNSFVTRGSDFDTAGIVTNLETVEFANAIAFGVKGDANSDNIADMSDALLIMRKSLGSDIEFGISATYLSDVNEDGTIDLTDALSTMRLALN